MAVGAREHRLERQSVVAVAPPPAPAASGSASRATARPAAPWWPLLPLLAVAAALRFFHIAAQSIWYDEGVSIGMVGQGPAAIVRQAAADFHPPLYYLLLAAWARVFGDGEVALRGLSAVAGVLLVLLTWLLARRLFGSRAGWLAAGWAALAPLGVAFSQELRMYMLVAAAVALAAWCAAVWLDAAADGRPATGHLACYALAAAAALYVQYVALFGLAAVALYGLVRARGRALLAWTGANPAAVLLFAPWLPAMHYQYNIGRKAPVNQGGHDVLAAAAGSLLVGTDGLPMATTVAVILLAGLVAAGVWRAAGRGPRGWLPITLAAFPVLGAALGAAWKAVYEVHYILAALPGVAILGALGLEQFAVWVGTIGPGRRAPRRTAGRGLAAGVLAVGCLLVAAASAAADGRELLAPPHPHDDYRALAATVASEGRPGDAVLLYPPGQDHVFGYYYRGPDEVVGLPRQRPPDAADTEARLEALFRAHPRVWLVQYGASEADPSGIVPDWLGRHAFLAGHRWFGSAQLLLYAAAPGPGAATPLGAHLANGAQLAAYTVAPAVARPGATLGVTLEWVADAPIDGRYTVFTHLLNAQNKVVAQHDGEPAGGTRPTTTWRPGERVSDMHGLALPADLPPGVYTVEVGMYLPSGRRARVLGAGDGPGSDRLLLGRVEVRAG